MNASQILIQGMLRSDGLLELEETPKPSSRSG